jgi:hypothetical protein
MTDLRIIINKNKPLSALILFFGLYFLIYLYKPTFLFVKPTNQPREFGIGYKNKTILPLWLFSILLGIISYFIIVYYLHSPVLFM